MTTLLPEDHSVDSLQAYIVENDPKVPWVVAVIENGPHQGERTYVFPPDWTPEMQDRALLEWGAAQ